MKSLDTFYHKVTIFAMQNTAPVGNPTGAVLLYRGYDFAWFGRGSEWHCDPGDLLHFLICFKNCEGEQLQYFLNALLKW